MRAEVVLSRNASSKSAWVLGALAILPSLRLALAFTVFDLVIAGMWLMILLFRKPPAGTLKGLLPPAFLILAGMMLGITRAPDPVEAAVVVGQWSFVFFVVFPVVTWHFREFRHFRAVAIGMTVSLAVVALFGVREVFLLAKPYSAYRYRSILGDPQVAGFYIAFGIPFVILTYQLARSWTRRILAPMAAMATLIVAATLIWFLQMTLSRTGWLALLCALSVQFILSSPLHKRVALGRTGRFVFLIVGLTAGFIFYSSQLAPADVTSRIEQTRSLSSPEVTDRTDGYLAALEYDPTYYIVGIGGDNAASLSPNGQSPHDALILLSIEGGFLAVAGYVMLLAIFFRRIMAGLRFCRKVGDKRLSQFLVACAASMSAYVVIALLNTQVYSSGYWFIYAIGVAGVQVARSRSSTNQQVIHSGTTGDYRVSMERLLPTAMTPLKGSQRADTTRNHGMTR